MTARASSRGMLCTVVSALALVALGSLINLGVAMALAWVFPVTPRSERVSEWLRQGARWVTPTEFSQSSPPDYRTTARSVGVTSIGIQRVEDQHGGAAPDGAIGAEFELRSQTVILTGWPFRSFIAVWDSQTPGVQSHPTGVWAGVPYPRLFNRNRLPVRRAGLVPVGSGLLANTMCFAAMLVCARLLYRRLRIAMRQRAGECLKCGYPTSPDTTCPECGSA